MAIKFFTPGADVLNDTPTYELNLTTTRSATENTAVYEATGIEPGTYDITAVGEHTLINVKRGVVISAPNTSVHMGTLLEGDANGDGIVDFDDFAILSVCWLVSKGQAKYDTRTDFDCNGFIDIADFSLLAAHWLRNSPVEIPFSLPQTD